MPLDLNEIIKITGVHPLKVKNVYLFGSRVYGTFDENSDYDIVVVANTMNPTEIRHENYNIHVKNPDDFYAHLLQLDIHNLECVFAPESAKLQEKVKYAEDKKFLETLKKKEQMKFRAMSLSFNSFHKAKMCMLDGDTTRGLKSLFHSMRMLLFAIQVLEHGKIVDFAEANKLWESIKIEERVTMMVTDENMLWSYFKEAFLPEKIKLEKKLKSL